jgi:hypothetical protein
MPEDLKPVWVCDKCGHTWLQSERMPTHCASSKCRSRRWNAKRTVHSVEQGAVVIEETRHWIPDVDAT